MAPANSSLFSALTKYNLSSFQKPLELRIPMAYHYDYRTLCVNILWFRDCRSPCNELRPFLALQLDDWFRRGAFDFTRESANQVWLDSWRFAHCVEQEPWPAQPGARKQVLFRIWMQPLEVESRWLDQGWGIARRRWGWRRCSWCSIWIMEL